MRKAPGIAALRAQRTATLRRLSQLPDDAWDGPCLPPWTVRHVAAHLIAVDEATVTGRLYRVLRAATDRKELERWNDESLQRWVHGSPTELLEGLVRWGERLAALASRTPSVVGRIRLHTWAGRQPLLFLVYRRVLDEWVHECDLAWATHAVAPGDAVTAEGAVPDVLAEAVLSALPGVVLPRTERTHGVVRLIVDTGSGRRRTWGVDFARRQYGPRVNAAPDAVVRTDARTIALLSERRWDRARLSPRHLAVEGDDSVASDLLDAFERVR